jgi:HPt (histidine-containing phosphotransfer) domain-containing protein
VTELDSDIVAELIEQFLADTPGQISALREAAKTSDLPTLARLAHSVAGSSGTFGLQELRTQCLALEEFALARETAKIAPAIEAVCALFEAAVPTLRRFSGR